MHFVSHVCPHLIEGKKETRNHNSLSVWFTENPHRTPSEQRGSIASTRPAALEVYSKQLEEISETHTDNRGVISAIIQLDAPEMPDLQSFISDREDTQGIEKGAKQTETGL